MHEVTRILKVIQGGDAGAAGRLLPLVYDELRRLAAQKLAGERPGQTLQATALVHEAYVRLVGGGTPTRWAQPPGSSSPAPSGLQAGRFPAAEPCRGACTTAPGSCCPPGRR